MHHPILSRRRFSAISIAAALSPVTAFAETASPGGGRQWRSVNRGLAAIDEGGRKFMRLDARPDEGVAWLVGSDFIDGAIEVELRGRDVPNQSFVGIAFRGVDDKKYEAIYFRPFNFRTPDPARVVHAVQYVSSPDFPWHRLRAEHPGVYEKPVSPVPDPNDWFHARIEIKGQAIRVYVSGSDTPSLSVTGLSEPVRGLVGLFVGNESPGDFANLKLTAG